MRFGPVPLSDALNATLAHSVAVAEGRLRKGRVLEQPDIDALSAAGIEEVIVARLDPGDIDENAGAAKLAQALCGPGLRMSNPFTGRVNLLSDGPGVVVMDRAALEAVNAVHPMITLATVPPHQQMGENGMVATIKIISYAVPADAVEAACAAAAEGALRLAAPVLGDATLIITDVPGGAGEKGRAAVDAKHELLILYTLVPSNPPLQLEELPSQLGDRRLLVVELLLLRLERLLLLEERVGLQALARRG